MYVFIFLIIFTMLGSEEVLLSELYDVDLDNNYFNSDINFSYSTNELNPNLVSEYNE